MITDLANLGPSMRTTDLGAGSKKKDLGTDSQSGKIGQSSESFGQVFKKQQLQGKQNEARPNFAKPDPAPVRKDIDRAVPEKVGKDQVPAKANASDTRTTQKKEWDEPRSVKDNGRSEEVGEKSNERDAKIRQSVMLDFMDSMESEFGIPPTTMVEAMTNLSDKALEASPEETASQVIAQLDLSEEEKPEAYAMYMGMLAQLSQLQQPKPQPSLVAETVVAAAAVPAMMSHQQRRSLLNQNLDQMNSKFFMQGPEALKPQANADGMLSQKAALPDSGLGESAIQDQVSLRNSGLNANVPPQFDMQGKLANLQGQKAPMKPEMDANPELNLKALGLENIDPNSAEAKDLAKKLAALGAAAAALGEGMKSDPQNMQALKAESSMNQIANGDLNSMKSEILSGDRDQDDMGEGSGREGSSNSFMVHQNAGHLAQAKAVGSEQQSFGTLMAGATATGANAAADSTDNKTAMQQIMNQANFMIKKGGGEAKVQLNPEGLGEIHMKVSVADGKVGIEMSAETKEAKKLIESSLSDLKSSLGQHRLGLEHLKVDVGNQASSDNNNSESQNQQKQMDARQDQSKEQARDFWNQFNDGGQERRASFMDSPGIRAYGGTRKVEPMTPNTTGTASVKRYSGSGKGRGLDLVA